MHLEEKQMKYAIKVLNDIKGHYQLQAQGFQFSLDAGIEALSEKLTGKDVTEKDVKEYCDKHNLTIVDNYYKEEFVRAWCRHNGFLLFRKRKTDKSKLDIKWFENVGGNK